MCSFEQVLDEADRLLNEEFEKSLDEILNVIPRDRRTYLFSATMTKKVVVSSSLWWKFNDYNFHFVFSLVFSLIFSLKLFILFLTYFPAGCPEL